MAMVTSIDAPPTCSARVGTFAGEWSEMPLFCSTSVGLTRYTDIHGAEQRYCRHHKALVLYRYPAAPLAEGCVICHKPVDDLAISINVGPNVGEVCWRCQDKADPS